MFYIKAVDWIRPRISGVGSHCSTSGILLQTKQWPSFLLFYFPFTQKVKKVKTVLKEIKDKKAILEANKTLYF